jgi:hypothetical protein
MFAQSLCLYNVCAMFAHCLRNVCATFAQRLHNVCTTLAHGLHMVAQGLRTVICKVCTGLRKVCSRFAQGSSLRMVAQGLCMVCVRSMLFAQGLRMVCAIFAQRFYCLRTMFAQRFRNVCAAGVLPTRERKHCSNTFAQCLCSVCSEGNLLMSSNM